MTTDLLGLAQETLDLALKAGASAAAAEPVPSAVCPPIACSFI